MPPVVIDNPILNSPFEEPARHFRFDDDGITSEIAEGRRRSTYFIPIPKPRIKGGAQLSLPGDWVAERILHATLASGWSKKQIADVD